ncbi:alpha-L-fucosidase [Pedobacter aquae]|uniref:alpha-L-fucosidase n=1 Tax=Pedobacter aquae TaxID=2605747 RepID=A0A5C0VFQ9_9SPHI|nr:alpha-L-fucosidase [Pedobacter aquae]QEK51578.1 alpha-L-fucosidase [Pedobacter aquae]
MTRLNCRITGILASLFFLVSFSSTLKAQKFEANLESFKQYEYPAWFRDAKFGIWSHWGPQAVPRQGDWYARDMYQSDYYDRKKNEYTGKPHPAYLYHVKTYGHPSKFGYKDLLPLWKAERWNPEQLMALFKRVGAKYFVSMAVHHDNFFLWNSKIHKWNSVNIGPKKDVVALWQQAAKKEGLRFGVSEHLGASYNWFQTNKGADKTGPLAGVPYDGNDPQYEDLYYAKSDEKAWLTTDPKNHAHWLKSVKELIDLYQPDLLYSDSELPFGETGHKMLAHFYNQDIAKNNGKLEAVYNSKRRPSEGRWVQDIERGVMDSISPFPWQTDTSIGDWFYRTGQKYRSGTEILQMLVDIVSKNGNLLINVVQTPEGDLEPDVLNILEEIAAWTPVNGEAIYGSRPWKIYGEGPSTSSNKPEGKFGGVSDERSFESTDIRFTTKGETLYAFCMKNPQNEISIQALGKNTKYNNKTIASIELLGSKEKLNWKQENGKLVIQKPTKLPNSQVTTYKIQFKN